MNLWIKEIRRISKLIILLCAYTFVGILGNILWPSSFWHMYFGCVLLGCIFLLMLMKGTIDRDKNPELPRKPER